jgi:hypothetical protein
MSGSQRIIRVVRVLVACGAAVVLSRAGLDAEAQPGGSRRPPVLNFVGVTAHAWGVWVRPGVEVEDWVEEARDYCAPEQYCEVNVFEGAQLATHEYPVPEANRAALKWVFVYRDDAMPKIVIEEAHAAPGQEKRRWVFED